MGGGETSILKLRRVRTSIRHLIFMMVDSESSGSKVRFGLMALLAILILAWMLAPNQGSTPKPRPKGTDNGGERPVVKQENLIAQNPILSKSHEKLALLQDCYDLDQFVVDRCFAPVVLTPDQFDSEEKFNLVRQFQKEIDTYDSFEALNQFSINVGLLVKMEGSPDDPELARHLEKFREQPGSGPILAGNRDEDLLRAFHYLTTQRLKKLLASQQIKDMKSDFDQKWRPELEKKGIELSEIPPPKDVEDSEKTRILLRHWELTSTRFILAVSGNVSINRKVQENFPGETRPVYSHALNAALDPVRRRFRNITTYQPQIETDPDPEGLFEVPDGPYVLVEFTGALARAKLYSDWRQGVAEKQAKDMLFRPGFDPHLQCLIRETGLPEPEHPAATVDLPAVEISTLNEKETALTVPALNHNAVLFLNTSSSGKWTATVDGQPAAILRANNNAMAVYLDSSKAKRIIRFQRSTP